MRLGRVLEDLVLARGFHGTVNGVEEILVADMVKQPIRFWSYDASVSS
jgi:hypothetical protein